MPQRFLRPGITTSHRFNRLPFEAQSFFVRLLTLVDDFGRYEADFRLLRSHVFPLGDPAGNDVSLQTIENICKHLQTNVLIQTYIANNGKAYLQVLQWEERPRAKGSKFPQFDNTCKQMFADVNKCSGNDNKCSAPSPSSSSSSSPSSSSSSFPPNPPLASPTVLANGTGEGTEDRVLHAEAKAAIWDIGKRIYKVEGAWSERQIYDDWLNEALPMARPHFNALLWHYSLPEDHWIFQSDFAAYAKRRGSFPSLLSRLDATAQQSLQVYEKFKAAGSKEKNEEPPGYLT